MLLAQEPQPNFCFMGEAAAVLQLDPPIQPAIQARLWAVAQALLAGGRFVDVVMGMHNLTVVFDPTRLCADEAMQKLQQGWRSTPKRIVAPRQRVLRVRYGAEHGPDLALVAQHANLSPDEVIGLHASAAYTVAFVGFQPGFAYLMGLPEALHTPRRATPRPRVPAGSVGIGGAQTGVYPTHSPGGWQLIGRVEQPLFDPQEDPPGWLQAGDMVRFEPI